MPISWQKILLEQYSIHIITNFCAIWCFFAKQAADFADGFIIHQFSVSVWSCYHRIRLHEVLPQYFPPLQSMICISVLQKYSHNMSHFFMHKSPNITYNNASQRNIYIARYSAY